MSSKINKCFFLRILEIYAFTFLLIMKCPTIRRRKILMTQLYQAYRPINIEVFEVNHFSVCFCGISSLKTKNVPLERQLDYSAIIQNKTHQRRRLPLRTW